MTEERRTPAAVPPPRDWPAGRDDEPPQARAAAEGETKLRTFWEKLGKLFQLHPRGPFGT